ncbi:MAG: SH3 domain-containing protein [Fusicatenibacter sp.]|nr:SH3 domain-containing protein [Fusicatenibacter sp.]
MKGKMQLCFSFMAAAALLLGGCSALLTEENQTKSSASAANMRKEVTAAKEKEKSETEFTTSYRNLSLTLPPNWSVSEDKKSISRFEAESGDTLEISFTEGMAKVTVLEFPMSREEANAAASEAGHLEDDWLIADYSSGTYRSEETVDYYQYLLKNRNTSSAIYKAGVRTTRQAYLITAKLTDADETCMEELTGILRSLQFLDEEELTEAFLAGLDGEKENLQGEEESEEAPAGTQMARCSSPVNVRTAPNVSNSQILGYLEIGEEVRVLEIVNNWYKIEYQGGIGYAYGDYLEEIE